MALTAGAFTFGQTEILATAATEATALQASIDLRTAMVADLAGEGWSAGSSEFSWTGFNASRVAALADLDHTSGAKLWVGFYFSTSAVTITTLINAVNCGNTGNFNISTQQPALLVAYWPPGSGVTLASDPGTTNDPYTTNQTFIAGSIDPLRIVGASSVTTTTWTPSILASYAAQGNTVWLTFGVRETETFGCRAVLAAGQIIIPTSPTDVASYAGYGIARLGSSAYYAGVGRASATNAEIQCYTELATTAETTVLITSAQPELGVWSVTRQAPVQLFPIYVYKNASATWPGIKGYLDPALAMAGPDAIPTGARVGATGERTHLGNGLYMGYQAGAGDWYLV